MSVIATVLFDTPRRELASLLRAKLSGATRTDIVIGFATVEGMATLEAPLAANPAAVQTIVVGAGTYRAYEAFDRLIGRHISPGCLFVHLGHANTTRSEAQHRFYRYRPMLHSKVYYMEYTDGTAAAIVGSHNATGFALLGLNGEAAVLLEGKQTSPEFDKIRRHIAAARSEAIPYSPSMKDAFAWWTHQFFEGLADKMRDRPTDGEPKKTIVIMCETPSGKLPKKADTVYFELRASLGKIQSMRAEIHLYIFDKLPMSPDDGLGRLDQALASFWCRTEGLESEQGGVELLADWQIEDDHHPVLKPTRKPFRPTPSRDMQQVRAGIRGELFGAFEYLFELPSPGWLPDLDEQASIQISSEYRQQLSKLRLVPREDMPWYLVRGLSSGESEGENKYHTALIEMMPAAGSYVLMSARRKSRKK